MPPQLHKRVKVPREKSFFAACVSVKWKACDGSSLTRAALSVVCPMPLSFSAVLNALVTVVNWDAPLFVVPVAIWKRKAGNVSFRENERCPQLSGATEARSFKAAVWLHPNRMTCSRYLMPAKRQGDVCIQNRSSKRPIPMPKYLLLFISYRMAQRSTANTLEHMLPNVLKCVISDGEDIN